MFNKNNGFTLVEIIISITLLGIIAIAVFPVFSNIFNSIFSAGDKTVATYQAQQDIINDLESGSGSSTTVTFSNGGSIDIDINANMFNATSSYKKPNVKAASEQVQIYYYRYATP